MIIQQDGDDSMAFEIMAMIGNAIGDKLKDHRDNLDHYMKRYDYMDDDALVKKYNSKYSSLTEKQAIYRLKKKREEMKSK